MGLCGSPPGDGRSGCARTVAVDGELTEKVGGREALARGSCSLAAQAAGGRYMKEGG
jgi:hypothetical protein